MTADQFAHAAEALVGSPFRLHGRDPASGLDCIGVFAAAMAGAGQPVSVPSGYRMRSRTAPELDAIAREAGFTAVSGDPQSGDVLFCPVGGCQFHLVIVTGEGRLVHAHAGLRRVVVSPAPLPWPIIGHWRLSPAS